MGHTVVQDEIPYRYHMVFKIHQNKYPVIQEFIPLNLNQSGKIRAKYEITIDRNIHMCFLPKT